MSNKKTISINMHPKLHEALKTFVNENRIEAVSVSHLISKVMLSYLRQKGAFIQ